jgi:hypothetical protein
MYKIKNSNLIYYALIIFIIVGIYIIFRDNNNTIKQPNSENRIKGSIKTLEADMLINTANEEKDLLVAENLYNLALSKLPEERHWQVYVNLGHTYLDHKEYKKAEENLTKSIKLNPDCDICYQKRGIVYSKLNEINKSLSDYNKSISIKPDEITYYNRHLLYDSYLNDENKSLEDLKSAIKINNSYIIPYIPLIMYLSNNNYYKESHEYLTLLKKSINKNDIKNNTIHLFLESFLNYREDKMDDFFNGINKVCEVNSEYIKNKNETISSKIFLSVYFIAVKEYIKSQKFNDGLKILEYSLEIAKVKKDKITEDKILKDIAFVKSLIKNKDFAYHYVKEDLEINK